MYVFNKGTVDITANTHAWFDEKPFVLVFASKDHNGWGITKAITEDEATQISEPVAQDFYFTALNFLGISAFE